MDTDEAHRLDIQHFVLHRYTEFILWTHTVYAQCRHT